MSLLSASRLLRRGQLSLRHLQAASAAIFEKSSLPLQAGNALSRQLLHTHSRSLLEAGSCARHARALEQHSALWAPARFFRTSTSAHGTVEINVPSMGDSVSEGTVATVTKKPGDVVKEDDVLAQIETDKVTMDVKYTASTPGKVTDVLVKEGDTVVVGQPVARVEQSADAAAAPSPAETDAKPKAAPDSSEAAQAKQEAAPKPAVAPPAPAPKAPKAPSPPLKPATAAPAAAAAAAAPPARTGGRTERRVKMSRLRLRVAERLKAAQNTYAMLTTFNEVDMTKLMELRSTYKDVFFERHGVKLGFMSAFVKAATVALMEVPAVNAVIDGDEIVYRDYCDISIAVATPKGLVVPVLRDAHLLGFADIEKTINELGRKAREGTISIDEMAGGTFTISNGGVYGSMLSTPIINPPQSAILGMHAINKRAWVVDSKIEPRPIMYLALTYDHRLIDGREAVTFLKRIKEIIEDPARLVLDV